MYSRLSNHRCPNGHYLKPSLAVAAGKELVCSECGVHFYAPSAEELAFNSQGACQKCGGTGIVHTVDMAEWIDNKLNLIKPSFAPMYLELTSNVPKWLETRAIDSHRANSRLLKKALRLTERDDIGSVLR